MFGPYFVGRTWCHFKLSNHLDEEGRNGRFTLIAFLKSCYCYCSRALSYGDMGRSVMNTCGIS